MHQSAVAALVLVSLAAGAARVLPPCTALPGLWQRLWRPLETLNATHGHDDDIDPVSFLGDTNRTIWVITTASLPWMTGTAVNPLLRAAFLAKSRPSGKVTLVLPWLLKHDQELAFSSSIRFDSQQEQREYVQTWLTTEADLAPDVVNKLNISFYPARYHDEFHSIFPVKDISALIPDHLADVCILEEPEHLNWYKAPFTAQAWMDKFSFVVGIIHTNYIMYCRTHSLGQVASPLLYLINQGLCRAYCHKVIKLSAALQEFAPTKEVICNVHGVRGKYLSVGTVSCRQLSKGAYFIGKLAWQKGLGELFELSSYAAMRTERSVPIDIYGSGPHSKEIRVAAARLGTKFSFFAPRDHADLLSYRVFVNPSQSEVLCTTIAEALAMGKWVVCARHPSNEFFKQFPSCLPFADKEEFVANLMWSMHHEPPALSAREQHLLSWDAAIDRLVGAAAMTRRAFRQSRVFGDEVSAWLFEKLGCGELGDVFRSLTGGKTRVQ